MPGEQSKAAAVLERVAALNGADEFAELAEQIVVTFKRFRRILRSETEGTEVVSSLTREQLLVLASLRYGPLSMSQIAEVVGITRGGATGLVKRLVALGYVERLDTPENRRTVLVGLTSVGNEVQAEVYHRSVAAASRLLRRLSAEELKATRTALAALDRLARAEHPRLP